MNPLECYIKEVHSVEDVTDRFKMKVGYTPDEPLLHVDITYNCYGQVTRVIQPFSKSEWEEAKRNGYFLA